MKSLTYNGYAARIEFDAEDELFIGQIVGINDVIGFHADSVEALKSAFQEAVDDYLDACKRSEKAPAKPYSGKVMFRISPEIHAKAALKAQLEGISLNQWAEKALEKASA